jgi:hypothetical protein
MNQTLQEFATTLARAPHPELASRIVRSLREEGECWIWTRSTPTLPGAGPGGRSISPRRALLRAIGHEDMLQHEVTATCRNPKCCRPDHIVLRKTLARTSYGRSDGNALSIARATADLLRSAETLRGFGLDVEALLRG